MLTRSPITSCEQRIRRDKFPQRPVTKNKQHRGPLFSRDSIPESSMLSLPVGDGLYVTTKVAI
jgi:hypothetical protein